MSLRRLVGAILVILLTAATTAACGGSDRPSAGASAGTTTPSTPSATDTSQLGQDEPAEPKDTALQQPKAEATIKPQATLSAVPGASELPAHGFRSVQGFPVPPGVKVKDPGPLDDTWQFDIHAADLDSVIAFYKRVLPQMGFRVRLGVSYELGNEQVYWDLVFDGRISGTMVRDPSNGVVFVVVNPPGQPAIAGES
ncbi:hypothetical protein [Nocardioides pocheonensis]|uniref:hypothetical protein n=1 Tax=Nocardioides pocheonensis TaxID=661485 RepID=UPI0011CDFDFA|nr:hypothetical protein [Nocardioides pocheonensis]